MERTEIQREIAQVLASETRAVVLCEKLFSPHGLFHLLASSEQERKALVKTSLFREAQARFRELQLQEAAAFHTLFASRGADVMGEFLVKMEKAPS